MTVRHRVSQIREVEKALRESEARFRMLAASVPVGIFQTDAEGKIEYVNQRVLKITGLTALEETSDWRWGIDPHPDDREAVLAERTKAMAEGRVFLGDFRILTPQGVTRWVETRICPLFNEKGEQLGHAGMVEDVTERRQAEEALRESEERFRTLYQSSRDGIAAADPDGRFTECNQAYADMLGYSRQELQRIRYQDITPSKWHALNADAVREAMERGYSEEFEKEYIKKDGTVFPVSLRVWRIEDAAGRPVGVWTIVRVITQRKQAEEALRESEARYKALFAGAPEGMLVADLETKQFRHANPAMCRMFGYTEEEFLRLGVMDVHPKESLSYVLAEFEAQARGEKLLSADLPCQRKDGSLFYADVNAIVVALDGRRCNVGFFTDVTERKKAEGALRESEKRFRQVLEVSSDLICRADIATGAAEYVSPAVLPLTGFTQEEFTALGMRAFRHRMHPDDWPRYKQRIDDLLFRGSDVDAAGRHEYRWRCKDGQYRWFSDSLALVRGEDGQPLALVVNARDTTERHEGEKALRESEERFRTLSAAAPIGIMLIDDKDGTVYCNERFLSIFGLPKEEAMGFGWVKTLHPDDREAFFDERSKAMAEGREFIREFRVVAPQGETRWLGVHTTPLLSQEGVSNSRVGTLEDITERKQAEEGDQQLHAEHVRANELRRMVGVLEQMAATLGHELRNPLGVISNSAYFLANQTGIDDPKVAKHAEIIGHEVASAKRVIDDILEFAHVPEILPSPASLNAIVLQALARSQVPANIRVTRKLAVDLPPLICDEERLERGFLDVITNAIQAMPHGGRLSVKTRRSAEGMAAVFADTGEGIAPQNLAKIFDPMFTTKLRGLGLGLTVVRRTVEQHGGRVEVKSALAHGTTITIVLPVDCRSAQSNDEALAKRPGRGAAEREEQSRETAAVAGAEQ